MAPRGTPKPTSQVQRTINKVTRPKSSPATIKKGLSCKSNTEKLLKVKTLESRPRTNTVPKMSTPKAKEQKSIPIPSGSVSKSAKKSTWKRRPKPAHSGVPVPEKMKKLFGKQLQDSDSSF